MCYAEIQGSKVQIFQAYAGDFTQQVVGSLFNKVKVHNNKSGPFVYLRIMKKIAPILALAGCLFFGHSAWGQVPNRFQEGAEEKSPPPPPPLPEKSESASEGQRPSTTSFSDLPLRDRLEFGGNFGLQFGTNTIVQLQPRVGYKFTEDFVAGLGITYIYYNYLITQGSRYESSIYGGTLYTRYNLFEPIFLAAEVEALSTDVLTINPITYEYSVNREWVPALYLGGGGAFGDPNGAQAFVFILYNVLYEPGRSVFGNPVIRFGFGF